MPSVAPVTGACMLTVCPGCALQLPAPTPFCPSCGRAVSSPSDPTIEAATAPPPVSVLRRPAENFLPGTLLAARYRIVALAGRGGMGEVYRADDLRLGQPVALKFLPADAREDPRALERFNAEARLARQISHPHVCRLYDIGEVDGECFLTMEYIDGEDLSSLIRRIGRLPPDKALEIARQLCAGVAAAHACGVLHRDLKPANVMIDGRGQVRITDFGIAGRTTDAQGPELLGTPAYLAPEQLAGGPATVATDIYALALVLYETFTGQPAVAPVSLFERVVAGYTPPVRPSEIVPDLSPAIERVLLQCLARDPAERPASVRTLAAALPGGDPLAAALAAGETPSPALVAVAGEVGGIRPAAGWALLLAIGLSLAFVASVADQVSLVRMMSPGKSPGALSERVSQIVARAGYPPAADAVGGFEMDDRYAAHVAAGNHAGANRRAAYRRDPAVALYFWERQSPLPLAAPRGIVTLTEPPLDVPGMLRVLVDGGGRLLRFDAVPPAGEPVQGASVDWNVLFEEAGLHLRDFAPAAPLMRPAVHADERRAWAGQYPGRPDLPVRIEAAALDGRPVLFAVVWPWSAAEQFQPGRASVPLPFVVAPLVLLALAAAVGVPLAVRNIRLGRGDVQGAKHLGVAVLTLSLAGSLLVMHHTATLAHAGVLLDTVALSVLYGAIAWLAYLSIEPYVRRHAPHLITSWTRLLSGQWRDPLVGRDLLIGVVTACGTLAVVYGLEAIATAIGRPAPQPIPTLPGMLGPPMAYAGLLLTQISFGPIAALGRLLLLLLFAALFRRWWPAVAVFVLLHVLLVLLGTQQYQTPAIAVLAAVVLALVLVRFGLLAAPVHGLLFIGMLHVPVHLDLAGGYASNAVILVLAASALAVFGFVTATAGRSRFGGPLLEAG